MLFIPLICLCGFLLYLYIEAILIKRWRRAIPLCISITGTRGKTTIGRLLGSIMRGNQKITFTKTTGSEACFIFPDGTVQQIKRTYLPSIIEQKKTLRLAAKNKSNLLISEIMSIHPENHFVESQKILNPNIVIITNIRLDHTAAMGRTKAEIAAVFCLDIPPRAIVFIPQEEITESIKKMVLKQRGRLIAVPAGYYNNLGKQSPHLQQNHFAQNLDLVYAVCRHLKITDEMILAGIKNTAIDIGLPVIYQIKLENRKFYFVNGFAANDPQSTVMLIQKIKKQIPEKDISLVGLLTLRSDRAERSDQWLQNLQTNPLFKSLYVHGQHAPIFKRRLNNCKIFKTDKADEITTVLLHELPENSIIFGFGNIKGMGEKLIEYWSEIRELYGS